jgi:hypothetical protein
VNAGAEIGTSIAHKSPVKLNYAVPDHPEIINQAENHHNEQFYFVFWMWHKSIKIKIKKMTYTASFRSGENVRAPVPMVPGYQT